MTEVPRRLPPTPAGRAKTVATTHASLSGHGSTKAARPVTGNQRQTRVYQPPAAKLPSDRLSVGFRINNMSLIPSAPFAISGWTFTEEVSGTGVSLNSPDDGGIYTFGPGVYAVNLWIRADGIDAAASTCAIWVQADIAEPFATTFGCGLRGGDPYNGTVLFSGASRVYYMAGEGFTSAAVSVNVNYANLDPAVTKLVVEAHVQKLTAL